MTINNTPSRRLLALAGWVLLCFAAASLGGLFAELGWAVAGPPPNAGVAGEPRDAGLLGRETKGEGVWVSRLRPALDRLNPALPPEAITAAVDELTRDRSAMGLPAANREIYALLKDGVRVSIAEAEAPPSSFAPSPRPFPLDDERTGQRNLTDA